ncbi:MPN527 family putative ECF transporter permease subunit [Mycoplasma anserisalpingitidis]|uniref:MPN527 family putative ECF transporter permease subunit n=1 Tax=Mycoplasma anserisalpingitidis TaxID=519450 RepID=UPI001CF62640|nr:ECF transporter S component [Mycoplasma anserisalpingitidis]UCU27764.1 hypothetical protein K9O38_01845 [Mycoplasma anserisalpingitidis]
MKKIIIFRIAILSIFLALVLIFDFISKFLKISFFTVELTTIFIFVFFVNINIVDGFVLIFLRFLLKVFVTGDTDLLTNLIGNVILLISNLTFIFTYLLFMKIFRKKDTNFVLKTIISFVCSVIITSLVMSLLNTFIFNSLYFYSFKLLERPSLSLLLENYQSKFKGYFLGINNYFLGSLAIYLSFNLFNGFIIFIISLPVIIWEHKTGFIKNFIKLHKETKY